jgi:hypothetical protein
MGTGPSKKGVRCREMRLPGREVRRLFLLGLVAMFATTFPASPAAQPVTLDHDGPILVSNMGDTSEAAPPSTPLTEAA